MCVTRHVRGKIRVSAVRLVLAESWLEMEQLPVGEEQGTGVGAVSVICFPKFFPPPLFLAIIHSQSSARFFHIEVLLLHSQLSARFFHILLLHSRRVFYAILSSAVRLVLAESCGRIIPKSSEAPADLLGGFEESAGGEQLVQRDENGWFEAEERRVVQPAGVSVQEERSSTVDHSGALQTAETGTAAGDGTLLRNLLTGEEEGLARSGGDGADDLVALNDQLEESSFAEARPADQRRDEDELRRRKNDEEEELRRMDAAEEENINSTPAVSELEETSIIPEEQAGDSFLLSDAHSDAHITVDDDVLDLERELPEIPADRPLSQTPEEEERAMDLHDDPSQRRCDGSSCRSIAGAGPSQLLETEQHDVEKEDLGETEQRDVVENKKTLLEQKQSDLSSSQDRAEDQEDSSFVDVGSTRFIDEGGVLCGRSNRSNTLNTIHLSTLMKIISKNIQIGALLSNNPRPLVPQEEKAAGDSDSTKVYSVYTNTCTRHKQPHVTNNLWFAKHNFSRSH